MEKITVAEAIAMLGPWFGTGALTAIIVAWIGYLRKSTPSEPRNGAIPRDHIMQLGAILADRSAMDRAALSAERLTESIDQHKDIIRELTRAIERIDLNRPTRQR